MASVTELSDPYANVMLGPRCGRDVCVSCFNLTDGYDRCYACTRSPRCLDAILPISYSIAGEQLHHALAGYKRLPRPAARRLALGLAAVLWRYLQAHEGCLAQAAGVSGFGIVTSVPASGSHGGALEEIAGRLVLPVRERYRVLLTRSEAELPPHQFSARRYRAVDELAGEDVLLIDDTWTTGANAQSAAAALRGAGARSVAAVVIGRYINRQWHRNDARLRALPQPFDWDHCAICASRGQVAA